MTKRSGLNMWITADERADINKLAALYADELGLTRINQNDTIMRAVRAVLEQKEKV